MANGNFKLKISNLFKVVSCNNCIMGVIYTKRYSHDDGWYMEWEVEQCHKCRYRGYYLVNYSNDSNKGTP